MKIPAIEVSKAPTADLVVRSVMDNCQRKTLDNVDRIRAALALHRSRVEDKRAAVALGVSEQSYRGTCSSASTPGCSTMCSNHVARLTPPRFSRPP